MISPLFHLLKAKGARTGKCGVPLNKNDFLNVIGDVYTAKNYQNGISKNMPCFNCFGLGEIVQQVVIIAKAMLVSDDCPWCEGVVSLRYTVRANAMIECDTCSYSMSI